MSILNRIVYYGFVIPISLLPFPLLYALSDVTYFLLYHVIGYRKKVVMGNIRNSFPNKSEKERREIASRFYKHFCDLTLESLKMFTISDEQARERMKYLNTELPDKYFKEGKSLIVAMAHYNNWELVAITVQMAMEHQTVAIYKPLTNKYFDSKMLASRQKYGLRMMHNRTVKEDFEKMRSQLTATFFLIDQAPSPHSKPHWMTFLGQETGVLLGTEKYSKDYDFPVLYLKVAKPKRGYYTCEFVEAFPEPLKTAEGEITEAVTRMLEQQIIEVPEFWLWSHRRWKRKRNS